jgi:hypothetical protein
MESNSTRKPVFGLAAGRSEREKVVDSECPAEERFEYRLSIAVFLMG